MMESKVKKNKKNKLYKIISTIPKNDLKIVLKMLRTFRTFGLRAFFFFFLIATFDQSNDRYSFRNGEPINDLPTTTMPAGIWLRKLVTRFIVPLPISTRLPVHREYHPPHVHLGNDELYRGA